MPIIKSAKKRLRQDKKRATRNQQVAEQIKKLLKTMRRSPSAKSLQQLTSSLDKAAKTHLIHPNKAARLKSRLAKLLTKPKATPVKKAAKSPAKKTSKK